MTIYQIKVTLQHLRPPVWRRFQVAGDTKLGKLHRVLQNVMGWTDSHLHAFAMGEETYGAPDPDFPTGMHSERNIRLDAIAGEGDTLHYEYDFGDGWEHTLKVEKVLEPEAGARYPRCLAGKRACPPEDCGGPLGYGQLLEIWRDSGHEEHDEVCEWLGEGFDPEAFDSDEVNKWLTKVR